MLESKEIIKSAKKNDLVFSHLLKMGHEQVVFFNDSDTNLKAIIAIHNTALGPSLGGCRMWNYKTDVDALNDVLRLSRGMSLKASISGLNLGGGKAVIMGDSSKDKTEDLLKKFGKFIDGLNGRYITAEDVGMTTQDMDIVSTQTKYVTGISREKGGSGDPSPVTAFGVYMGMKAAAKFKWGNDSLQGKKVVIQGVGKVGETLVSYLAKDQANIFVNDINKVNLSRVIEKYGVASIESKDIQLAQADIYAPCALGASLDSEFISLCNYSIIAGAANNQLANEQIHAKMLLERDIVYAPDFLINAGGLINVYSELNSLTRDEVYKKTEDIYNITLKILTEAQRRGITPNLAALEIANKRLQSKIIL